MGKSKGTTTGSRSDAEALEKTNKSLEQIAATLGFIVLQMSALKESKNLEKIRFLSKFGFDRNQIAAMLDSTPDTIGKELSILKAARGKRGADTKGADG